MVHYAHKYLINPAHKITISLVGVGGTGSRVLTNLAIMDRSLVSVGHPGLHVIAFDDDDVTEANIGRQSFIRADIGENKAQVMVTRINRALGLRWEFYPYRFEPSLLRSKDEKFLQSNILISCVDSLSSRRALKNIKWNNGHDSKNPLYWLDIGNGKYYGQYILSTLQGIDQGENEDGQTILLDMFELHPELTQKEDDVNTPSCSLREALLKQDLFVNPSMAINACHLLWRLFTEKKIDYQGAYVNMNTMQNSLIKI